MKRKKTITFIILALLFLSISLAVRAEETQSEDRYTYCPFCATEYYLRDWYYEDGIFYYCCHKCGVERTVQEKDLTVHHKKKTELTHNEGNI